MSDISVNGIPAQQAAGFTPLYLSSGIIPANVRSRKFLGIVTSDTSGNWSCDISAAGFPNVAYAAGMAVLSSGTGTQQMFIPVITSTTLTTISGKILTPTSAILGSLPFVLANTAVTFNLLVIGW